MSLLSEAMEPFVIMDKVTENDGYGSVVTKYEEGATIEAAAARNDSIEARVALKNQVKDIYTVVTHKSVVLRYHDVIKRVSDGKIFRITSDGDDNTTPKSSAIDARRVSAEEWELVNE